MDDRRAVAQMRRLMRGLEAFTECVWHRAQRLALRRYVQGLLSDSEDRDYLNAMLFSIQSPPVVVRDTVIHGSSVADRRITKEAVPGWVRAWDVRTGEHMWDFHTVPASADEFGSDTSIGSRATRSGRSRSGR